MDFYLGQILTGAWNFAPRGTMFCNGQLLPVNQNAALFSLLGTTYGGNGSSTFGLPNLQGRVPVHFGNGQGLQPYTLGQVGGVENTQLTIQNMPAHNHTATVTGNGTASFSATDGAATARAPAANSLLGRATEGDPNSNSIPQIYVPSGTANIALAGLNLAGAAIQVAPNGGSQPFPTLQPYLAINFVIVAQGVFPTRN